MGVQYTLADHKNRLFYDLDKAYGLCGALCEEASFGDASTLKEFERRFSISSWGETQEDVSRWRAYLKKTVEELFSFCKNASWDVSLLDDSSEDWILWDVLGYRYVGTRMACVHWDRDLAAECVREDCVVCPHCGMKGCALKYPEEHAGEDERAEETRRRAGSIRREKRSAMWPIFERGIWRP